MLGRAQSNVRRLGPFSGTQLTIIIVAGFMALSAPVGAYAAVSGSSVFITDHSTGTHASVTSLGDLQTATIPQEGSLDILAQTSGGASECGFYRVPTGSALVVTGIQFAGDGYAGGVDESLAIDEDLKAGCLEPTKTLSGAEFTSVSSEEDTFNPGFVVPSGRYLDFSNASPSGPDSFAWVHGYLIPSSACKVDCSGSIVTISGGRSQVVHLGP